MVNETTTNEQGTCTFEVEEGTVEITVSKEGFVETTETINVAEDKTVDIVLQEESVEEELESRTVEFTVQDSEEQGISGARITLTNTTTDVETTNSNGGTGSSGGSAINNLDYGTYTVSVTKADYLDATFTLTVADELSVDGDDVSINNQGKVVVTLSQ